MHEAHCPNCDARIDRAVPQIGAIIHCTECGTELEVISARPFEVDFTLEYGQVEDDEDDDQFTAARHAVHLLSR